MKFGLQLQCRSPYRVEPDGAIVLRPIAFTAGKPHPTAGVWLTRYQLKRCGESKVYNALFLASASGAAPTPQAYFPGTSNASPMLIQDAMAAAKMQAEISSGRQDCQNVDIFDMRSTRPEHDVIEEGKTFKGVWNEIWSFRMCGQMVNVTMTFIPDANGGTTFRSEAAQAEENAGTK